MQKYDQWLSFPLLGGYAFAVTAAALDPGGGKETRLFPPNCGEVFPSEIDAYESPPSYNTSQSRRGIKVSMTWRRV